VWYQYTSLKYNYFRVQINDPINLQSSDSIWLMQNNMWYLILSLLIHVDFRLTLDPSWLPVDFWWPREYDDLRPRPQPTSSGMHGVCKLWHFHLAWSKICPYLRPVRWICVKILNLISILNINTAFEIYPRNDTYRSL